MINVLIKTLQIDMLYSVNSFLYTIKRIPIFKDLFTDDIYKSKIIKKIISLFGLLFSIARSIAFKYMYFFVIYFYSVKVCKNYQEETFIHIFFFLTILGMFINNKLLSTNKKKYFSIIIFKLDATKFFRANIIWNTITNTFFNTIIIYYFLSKMNSKYTLIYTMLLVLFNILIRFIGETLNIIFFKKYKYIWYTNSKMYFPVLILLLGCCGLSYFKIIIPVKIIGIVIIALIIPSVISLIYLFKIKDYRFMYKRLSQMTNTMDSKNEKDYLKQSMLEVRDKDKKIDSTLIDKKAGYDLFNTIFFQRHREILMRSAKKYSIVLIVIYAVLSYVMIKYSNYNKSIAELIHYKLSIFIMIMFIINRGSIITQAMFFNCDHAMLRYNFYREPKVILELFKKRLQTVVKVNLLPAFVIGIGNTILLYISSNNYSILTVITSFIFVLLLSIFFSVHYLVIYYLLQPYNKNMELKKASYTIVTLITYVATFLLTGIVLQPEILSIIGLLFVVTYLIISLVLISKFAPRTFKL